MSCLHIEKCITTVTFLNGHVDLVLWLPKDLHWGNLTNLTFFMMGITIITILIHGKLWLCIVFYLWWKMYYDDYLDSTDIRLNQNNAPKVPLWRLPRKIRGCTQKWKMYIYSYMDVSFSWWCHRCAETKTPPIQIPTVLCDVSCEASPWLDCAPRNSHAPVSLKRGKAQKLCTPSHTMGKISRRHKAGTGCMKRKAHTMVAKQHTTKATRLERVSSTFALETPAQTRPPCPPSFNNA
jgi:hypothetical protein